MKMKYHINISGQKKSVDVPTSWQDVTLKQGLSASKTGWVGLMAELIGVDKETLRNAKVHDYLELQTALKFLEKDPVDDGTVPSTILGFDVPGNVGDLEIGRYEDLKQYVTAHSRGLTGHFHVIVSLIVVKKDGMYNYQECLKKADMFLDAPFPDVVKVVNFFLGIRKRKKNGLRASFLRMIILVRKLLLVFKIYLKRLAFTVRFEILKKKATTK